MRWLMLLMLCGCTSTSVKQSGEECAASSECDRGLLCDFNVTPHVCAGMSSPPQPDAPPPPPVDGDVDAGVDAPPDAPVDAPPDAM
ncbi:MAG TPA: hypothetical protein VFQ53_27275 [Kofleriaceae bacterium]|nr:hypothetical protein [Kofleriaceae bacterium]